MGASTPRNELPDELAFRPDGTWRGYWREQKVFLAVAGAQDAPTATLLATLRDVISRWSDVQQTIVAFVRGLARDEHVPLEPRNRGGFAAGSCGFDQELVFSSIAVTDAASPHRVLITFYTGYPDGYATYEVVLDDGVRTAISAFAS